VSIDSSSPPHNAGASGPAGAVRAADLLKARRVWIAPIIMGSILVVVITVFYIGSVVDPVGHLHGLPVAVVNLDRGATVGTEHLDIGHKVQAGLSQSRQVTSRLGLSDATLGAARSAMDRDGYYATVVIPTDFSASLLQFAGITSGSGSRPPEIFIMTNQRAGNEGASLASGVLQPALEAASRQIGRQLTALAPSKDRSALTEAFLADPVTVITTQYRPLPNHSALGLTAFYIALLTLMCGFLGGIVVNSSVDAVLGYAATEIGPRWRQRLPVSISRWETLLTKWVIAAPLTAVMTGLTLLFAAGVLGMDAPHAFDLWLLAWLAAVSVAEGTIVLFATLGASLGQLLAILMFVYAGLASAGGTVPLDALPGWLRWLAEIEPLRQILDGTRAILYFDAHWDAGLARAVAAASAGLLFWLVAGAAAVKWYDRKGLSRMAPEVEAAVRHAADG
jgi:YhgE/Pip-like protein